MKLFDLFFGKMLDRRIAEYQSDLIQKHVFEVENVYKTMRGWRHDYHNHIQAMLALTDRPDEIRHYLLCLSDDLTAVDTVIKTGNVTLDAILNSKLSLIRNSGIEVSAKAAVPQNLPISDIDLCVIIGNLLDNALEACQSQSDEAERSIRIFIGVLKNQLYIYCRNTLDGIPKKLGGTYLSSKRKNGRGIGLMRIDSIAARNNGFVNRQHDDGIFATEVVIPLS